MAEEQTNDTPVAQPPKQSPFKTVAPAAGGTPPTIVIKRPTLRRPGEAPKPVTLKPPLAGQPVVQPLSQTANVAKGIEISHADAAKKVTSRISVSSATSPMPPVAPPPAPPAAPSPISPIRPAAPAATPIAAAAPAATTASPSMEKKVTSRITLESAFSAPSEMPASPAKTIKLKRPGAPSVPAPAAAPSPISPAAPAPLPGGMTPISDIEGGAAPAPAPEENLTRRKTIKVKRPTVSAGPQLAPGAVRPDGIATEEDNLQSLSNFAALPKAVVEPDKVNPIFIVAAVASILLSSLLIWTLASQAFGDNSTPPPWLSQISL